MNANMMEKFITKKLWISAVGYVLAIGYIINCIVQPAVSGNVRVIDWDNLNRALLILLIISGTRDITLNGIKWLGGKISVKSLPECNDPECQPFRKAVKRYWIPVVGWALVGGFVMNCIVWPFAPSIVEVNWDNLTSALLIVLVISGGRDISLEGVKLLGGKFSIKTPKCEHQKNATDSPDNEDADD